MSTPFPARYRGRCVACDEWFAEGATVRFTEEGIVHDDCAAVRDPLQGERSPCDQCFTVPAVNGACGCDPA